MILDKFALHSVVIQVEYDEALELWDCAGKISKCLTKIWPDLKVSEAVPQRQTLVGDGVTIQTGLEASTLTLHGPKSLDQVRTQRIKDTFDVWRKELELEDVKRISTRSQYIKEFDSLAEANKELLAMKLSRWPANKVFDQPYESSQNSLDISFRFQDENSFSVLRVKTEGLKYEVKLDQRFVDDALIKSEKNYVLIDFDRGLLGTVSAQKFRMEDWLKGYQHILRRDVDKVLGT